MSSFKTAQIRLVSSHPEVYEPCDDSFVLVDALLADRANLLEHHPTFCLEVGCGGGYVITSLALILGQEASGTHYVATDISPHAVRVSQETLEAHGVHAELVSTNIASGLEKRLAGMVDVLVVNPPYVPTPEDEVGREGIASAWAGGENGRSVIDKILPVADNLLSDKGWLYMVTLIANNPSQICLQMREKGYASRIVVQRSTEEESLHVIKFWKDIENQVDGKEPLHKTGSEVCMADNKVDLSTSVEASTDDFKIKKSDRLILRGLKFHGYHGVHLEEKRVGQTFLVDVDAWLDLRVAGESDDLSDTVSYTAIYSIAKEIMTGQSHNLLESVAQDIALNTLTTYNQITAVRVKIAKPDVVVRGPIDYLGVEIFRSRNKDAPSSNSC